MKTQEGNSSTGALSPVRGHHFIHKVGHQVTLLHAQNVSLGSDNWTFSLK